MRLLAFSDWRVQGIDDVFSFVQDLEDPVDFILYGGDDIGRFEEEGVNYFAELSRYTKQGMVLAVIGNDDVPELKRVLKSENVQDLYEEPFVFQNFAFIGLEASTSGPAIIKHTEKEVKEHLKKQHSEVRGKNLIILSHTPPHGILDLGIRFAKLDEGSHHIGSTSLRSFVQQNKVNLVICGHCHSHGGLSTQLLDTTIVNVSSHDHLGAKGNFALIDIDSQGQASIEWHDTFERLKMSSLMRLHSVGASQLVDFLLRSKRKDWYSIIPEIKVFNIDEITVEKFRDEQWCHKIIQDLQKEYESFCSESNIHFVHKS